MALTPALNQTNLQSVSRAFRVNALPTPHLPPTQDAFYERTHCATARADYVEITSFFNVQNVSERCRVRVFITPFSDLLLTSDSDVLLFANSDAHMASKFHLNSTSTSGLLKGRNESFYYVFSDFRWTLDYNFFPTTNSNAHMMFELHRNFTATSGLEEFFSHTIAEICDCMIDYLIMPDCLFRRCIATFRITTKKY